MFNRVAVATTAALLIFAAPAAASTAAAAGPSPTPLILELILAAVVITGMAVRPRVSRAVASVRQTVSRPRRRATTSALEPRA